MVRRTAKRGRSLLGRIQANWNEEKGKKQVPNCVPVNEGGNVFGTTNPIAKSDIEPTLEVFSDRLAKLFPAKAASFKQFEKLGSVGKKELSTEKRQILKDGV